MWRLSFKPRTQGKPRRYGECSPPGRGPSGWPEERGCKGEAPGSEGPNNVGPPGEGNHHEASTSPPAPPPVSTAVAPSRYKGAPHGTRVLLCAARPPQSVGPRGGSGREPRGAH
ncbi:unnamed protein product [Arctogadus glacialis]